MTYGHTRSLVPFNLGMLQMTSILVCGIQNPIRAENIIAQSKLTGKCFFHFNAGAL